VDTNGQHETPPVGTIARGGHGSAVLPCCPGCGLALAEFAGPGAARGWLCLRCNVQDDAEPARALHDALAHALRAAADAGQWRVVEQIAQALAARGSAPEK
jgi:hypothetical protein